LIEAQPKKSIYVHTLVISDQQKDLNISLLHFLDKSDCEKEKTYFEIIYSTHTSSYTIKEFEKNRIKKIFKYSRKGNLAWIKHYLSNNNFCVKSIFDYSQSMKKVHEKRFYNDLNEFVKKEVYDKNESLKSNIYYRKGIAYYKENFDLHGKLLESIYYNENGLKV